MLRVLTCAVQHYLIMYNYNFRLVIIYIKQIITAEHEMMPLSLSIICSITGNTGTNRGMVARYRQSSNGKNKVATVLQVLDIRHWHF